MKGRLDSLLAAGVERGAVPGATFCVVDANGVLYNGGAGVRSLGSSEAMTPDTVGQIYSMTKALTGAAAMQMVEEGVMELDAPAAEVCPELADVGVLDGFDVDGAPRLRPPIRPITLRNLLTHTSGFVYDLWNDDLVRWRRSSQVPDLRSGLRSSLIQPLMFDPGSRWEYGIGIDWVGQMIEATTGLTLGEVFQRRLTGPLGMTDTAFSLSASMTARLASIHLRQPDRSMIARPPDAASDGEFQSGGSGLYGTARDFCRFIELVLGHGEVRGERLLSAATVRAMASNQIGDLRVRPLRPTNLDVSNVAEFFPGQAKSWGLTFQINEEPAPTGRPAGTLMWAGLANSFYWIDLVNGVGGAYLSQILPFADEQSLGLFYELEQAVYESLLNND